ncbi:MAG: hypothetical protein LBT27_05595 [Prevotellaceae bacterium]|jgi:hypothetical protein|nr:hypothetical protein [Prevotellaceae bacterium]
MKINKLISVLLFIAAFCSCEKETNENLNIITERINDIIIIGHNQIFYDSKNDFRLQIDSVLNDSQCPIGVLCYWEGNAEVHFKLKMNEKQHIFNLNTHYNFRSDTVINNIKFKLVGLDPYPN